MRCVLTEHSVIAHDKCGARARQMSCVVSDGARLPCAPACAGLRSDPIRSRGTVRDRGWFIPWIRFVDERFVELSERFSFVEASG
jgi:hypothetical protein